MQNVPTSATITESSTTTAVLNNNEREEEDEKSTEQVELETTTESVTSDGITDVDEVDVTTFAQSFEQPDEAVTSMEIKPFSIDDETTTFSSTTKFETMKEIPKIPIAEGVPETESEVHAELLTPDHQGKSFQSISSQLKKPLDEVANERVEEDDIKLEVKWAEKVSTAEGTSMLIRIHASQNVEKVS